MKIVTLIENLTYTQGLVAEHGLSMLIDTGSTKILFDTGQSGLFLKNAKQLGIDIAEVDSLILSHGHYDHTGGLYPFLEANATAKVYAKKELFALKHSSPTRFIGTPYQEDKLTNRWTVVDSVVEIAPDIYIMPSIDIHHPVDVNFNRMFIKEGERLVSDTFEDELFVVVKKEGKIHIITACSHRGITNICQTAEAYFKLPIHLILGGFHMKECGVEQYVHILSTLRKFAPHQMGVCHCTGVDRFAAMSNECDAQVFYNFTGKVIEL